MPIAVGSHPPTDWIQGSIPRGWNDTRAFITSSKALWLWGIVTALAAGLSSIVIPAPKSIWSDLHLVPILSALAIPAVVGAISFMGLTLMAPYKQRNEARRTRDNLYEVQFPQGSLEPVEARLAIQELIESGALLLDNIPPTMIPLDCYQKTREVLAWNLDVDRTLNKIALPLKITVLSGGSLHDQVATPTLLKDWLCGVIGRLQNVIEDSVS